MKKDRVVSWVIFILLSIIWGSSFIAMKKAAENLNGWQIASVRMFSAGLFFLPFAIYHISKLPRSKILLIFLTGVIGNFIPAFLFGIAIHEKIESSVAGILNSLTPIFVVLFGIFFFKAVIKRNKIMGVLLSFIGLIVLSLSQGPISISNTGFILLILIATILYGINVNLVGHYLKGLNPYGMAAVSLSFVAIPSGFIMWQQQVMPSVIHNETFRLSFYYAVLLGVIGSAVSTGLFYALLQKSGPVFASMVTYAIPIVAMGWGLYAGEDVGLLQIICLGIILAGVYIAKDK